MEPPLGIESTLKLLCEDGSREEARRLIGVTSRAEKSVRRVKAKAKGEGEGEHEHEQEQGEMEPPLGIESTLKLLCEDGSREEARRLIGVTSRAEKSVRRVKVGDKVELTVKGKIMEVHNTIWIADEAHTSPFLTTTLDGKTNIYTPPILIVKRKRLPNESHGEYLADVIGPCFMKFFTELGYTTEYCADLLSQLRNSKHELKLTKKKKKKSSDSPFYMDEMNEALIHRGCACGSCPA